MRDEHWQEYVRSLRNLLGVSQEGLARLVNRSASTVARWEERGLIPARASKAALEEIAYIAESTWVDLMAQGREPTSKEILAAVLRAIASKKTTSVIRKSAHRVCSGEQIKALRLRNGLTQVEFGHRIGGFSEEAVRRWETGKAVPSRVAVANIQSISRIAS